VDEDDEDIGVSESAKLDLCLAFTRHTILDEDLRASVMEYFEDRLQWVYKHNLLDYVQTIWNPDYQPEPIERRPVCAPEEEGVYAPPPRPWSVGLTPTFQKSINQGRR
jgi:hypothetical protein